MNKLLILFTLLISVASTSIGQSDIVLLPESEVSEKPLSSVHYTALDGSRDVMIFRWRQNVLKTSQVAEGKRDLVCFDSNDRVLWSYEYENMSVFRHCKNKIICSESLSYGYLIDPGLMNYTYSKKNPEILLNIYRFDESGEIVKKEIKITDFNGSAKSNFVKKDFWEIESAIVFSDGLLFTISAESRDGLKSYICKLNNDFELSVHEVLSEYPYSFVPTHDKATLRTISLINDTLILMHCHKDKESNVKLRLFFYDVFNMDKSKTLDYSIKTSEFGSLIRAVESECTSPDQNISTPDGIVRFLNWSDGGCTNGRQTAGLDFSGTVFSLDAHIVVNNIQGGLILYGFCGDKKNDRVERKIWYAELLFANDGDDEKVREVSPTTIEISGIDANESDGYITTGTLDLSYSANQLIFSYLMKKNGHSLGDNRTYKNYFTLLR